jgi:hypothetical protein
LKPLDVVVPDPTLRHKVEIAVGNIIESIRLATSYQMTVEFYEDDNWANASMSLAKVPIGVDGRLLIGWTLAHRIINSSENPFYLAAILAHESAHVVQLRTGLCKPLIDRGRVVRVELHADYLAGVILERSKIALPVAAAHALVEAWEKLGDAEYTNINHHGTRDERLAALSAGFTDGAIREDFHSLTQTGAQAIRKLRLCDSTCNQPK